MSTAASSQVVWVAGVGASAGLGGALARRFAKAGFIVAITGRNAERLEGVATEIRTAGGRAFALAGDVGREPDVLSLGRRVSELGQLEVGIFNAGNADRAPSLELSVDAFEQAWRSSTLAGFIFGREVIKALVPRKQGALFFTGATASLRGKPPFAAFAAAKAGLRSLSQSFAREFGPQGVHVAHVVIDGGIDGERLRSRAAQRVTQAGPDGLLNLEAIAEVYFQLHLQHRSAWTQELDLRPYKEPF
ncbi:MAG TPA: SDR family NAD(P)-dependent oxidoreductase [Polyangiaceae bacterium]|nr:SDR family NAD(P)-dependent oxidoreductase [Polyangiaceae bacterium]